MIKFIVLVLLLTLLCRWAFGRWPWEYLQTRAPGDLDQARARRLLGVRAGASREQIREAHRRMAAKMHPDRGGSTARIAEINAARDILLAEIPDQQIEQDK